VTSEIRLRRKKKEKPRVKHKPFDIVMLYGLTKAVNSRMLDYCDLISDHDFEMNFVKVLRAGVTGGCWTLLTTMLLS